MVKPSIHFVVPLTMAILYPMPAGKSTRKSKQKIDFIFSTVGLPYYVTPMPIMPQGYNKKETYKGNNILLSTKEWLEKSDYNFTDDRNLIRVC